MGEIIARRLALMVLTMLVVSAVIFLVSEVVPIDLARDVLGQFADKDSIAAFNEQNGLNCPKAARYFIWLAGDTWVDSARNLWAHRPCRRIVTRRNWPGWGCCVATWATLFRTVRP